MKKTKNLNMTNKILITLIALSSIINAEYLMKHPIKKGIDFNIEKEYTEISPGVFEVVLINGEGSKKTFRTL